MELKQYAAEHIIENGKHYPEKWVNRYFIELADAQRALDAERADNAMAREAYWATIADLRSELATLQAQLRQVTQANARLRELLALACDHAEEHMEGCLYCGEDKEYVAENAESSPRHQRKCWWYRAQHALADTGVKNQDLIRIVCTWQFDDDDTDMAETECGHAFTFEDPDRAADWMKFCCYCGKPVELLRPEDIDEVNK